VTGHEYADLIARYLASTYESRGLRVYREVSLGKSIIGKNRSIDVFALHEEAKTALALECKYQASAGTVDEKIPYALADLEALWVPGCVVYAGDGFSTGVVHLLRGSKRAAYCLPDASLQPSTQTRELDHVVASVFGWWDVVLVGKQPVET